MYSHLIPTCCAVNSTLQANVNDSPDVIGIMRSKEASISEFQKIASARGERRTELKTASGLCDQQTAILDISIDAFR